MNTRRLIGLILASVTIPLNVMRADLVCASHGQPGASAVALARVAEMPDGMHADSGNATHEHRPCQTPSRSDCCEAVVSCSVLFAPCHEAVVAGEITTRVAAFTRVFDIPSWLIVPPDPPPPRA